MNNPGRGPSEAALAAGSHGARALLEEFGSWRRALRAARAEGLVPLVAAAVRAGRVTPPEHIGDVLQTKRRLSGIMLAAAAEAAVDASRALAERGVPHAVMKGAGVAPLYGDLSLRPMCDVDLIVRPVDVARAREALTALGYARSVSTPVETEFLPRADTPLGVSLDLHHRLAFPGQFSPDIDGMLARAVPRGGVAVLAPEDEVLVAALDVARDCFARVGRSMADVAVISHAFEVDWDAVRRRAREWGLTAAAWVALGCARLAFGARVPADVVTALRPSPAREAYLRAWLDVTRVSPYRMARRTSGGAPLRFAMCMLWPALVDGPLRRARFLARYALDRLRIARVATP